MPRTLLILALALLLTGAALFSYGVKMAYFNVTEEGRNFTITWQTELEEEVRDFELQRRTPFTNGDFVKLQTIRAHGANKPYLFRDDQVYKSATEQVEYRLEVVYQNGLHEVLITRSLNYTPTAVRRTWGSIKAMFQ